MAVLTCKPTDTYLYRFRGMSDNARSVVEHAITRREIFFTSPGTFNDPFDCKVEGARCKATTTS